jgi:ribosomal protein S18 acetylase RimI-like enzyme
MSIGDQSRCATGGGLLVIHATPSHTDAIVQLHILAFKGFFLESMGERFLKELYRAFIVEPSGLCLVAITGQHVVGFVAGTTQPDGFFRRLLRRRWYAFLLAGAFSLILHPIRVGKRFLYALRYRGGSPVNMPNATLLSSIGTAPSHEGRGIGKALVVAFCERAQASGAPGVFLTTDRDNNGLVNQFYLSNRFELHGSFLRDRSRWINLYTVSLRYKDGKARCCQI